MRKIIVVVLTVALLAIGVGGIVYAQTSTHEVFKGEKLIATARSGTFTGGVGDIRYFGWFEITNPECEAVIAIEHMAIIREDGAVIYEGPFMELVREDGEVINEIIINELQPHHVLFVSLSGMMKDPDSAEPDRWLTLEEARQLPLQRYTLEVFWDNQKGDLPLIGCVNTLRALITSEGPETHALSSSQMLSLAK
jgi:hypothetical protein